MFSDKLRLLRKERKMTQTELSKILGVSPSTIGMYEQGRREPDTQMLLKIANLFEVPAGYLIGNEERPRTQNTEEISELLQNLLCEKKNLCYEGQPLDAEDIERIIQAVQEGIHEAIEENHLDKSSSNSGNDC